MCDSCSGSTASGTEPAVPRTTWPRPAITPASSVVGRGARAGTRPRECTRSPVASAGMKIRAAVLEEFGRPLNVTEVDLAGPGPGEVLVRLVACGVCHTDLLTASGADPSGYAPAVLGHEGAGVVERVGDGVTSVAAGD